MAQGLRVLRGCFTAYLAGVLVIGTVNAITERGLEVFGAVAIFGFMLAIPFTIVALILWAVLAKLRVRITAVKAVAICGGVFALATVVTSGLAPLPLLGSFGVGALFGMAFWLGAFGFSRVEHLGEDPMRGASHADRAQ